MSDPLSRLLEAITELTQESIRISREARGCSCGGADKSVTQQDLRELRGRLEEALCETETKILKAIRDGSSLSSAGVTARNNASSLAQRALDAQERLEWSIAKSQTLLDQTEGK